MKKQTKVMWNVGLIGGLLLLLFVLEQILPSGSMLFTVLKKGAIYALVAVSMNLLNGFTGLFFLRSGGLYAVGRLYIRYLDDSGGIQSQCLSVF